jgi:hypothetical protein
MTVGFNDEAMLHTPVELKRRIGRLASKVADIDRKRKKLDARKFKLQSEIDRLRKFCAHNWVARPHGEGEHCTECREENFPFDF